MVYLVFIIIIFLRRLFLTIYASIFFFFFQNFYMNFGLKHRSTNFDRFIKGWVFFLKLNKIFKGYYFLFFGFAVICFTFRGWVFVVGLQVPGLLSIYTQALPRLTFTELFLHFIYLHDRNGIFSCISNPYIFNDNLHCSVGYYAIEIVALKKALNLCSLGAGIFFPFLVLLRNLEFFILETFSSPFCWRYFR